jgi:hypothetical protein
VQRGLEPYPKNNDFAPCFSPTGCYVIALFARRPVCVRDRLVPNVPAIATPQPPRFLHCVRNRCPVFRLVCAFNFWPVSLALIATWRNIRRPPRLGVNLWSPDWFSFPFCFLVIHNAHLLPSPLRNPTAIAALKSWVRFRLSSWLRSRLCGHSLNQPHAQYPPRRTC